MLTNETTHAFINSWGDFLNDCQSQHMQMVNSFLEGMDHHFPLPVRPLTPPVPVGDLMVNGIKTFMEDPSQLMQAQEELLTDLHTLWNKMLSPNTADTTLFSKDKRFRH